MIVRILGGTGNQLFQYAFARGVSAHLKKDFKLDISTCLDARWDPQKIHRKYSLDTYNTRIVLAKDSDMLGFVWVRKHYQKFDAFYRKMRLRRLIMPFYYPENGFEFDPKVFKRKGSTYFDGFRQSEKYFKHIEDEIRSELTVKVPLSEESLAMKAKIIASNAVSLHVRRGDYVTDPLAAQHHGTCSPEYYRNAIRYIEEKVPSPHFFVFSDDYEWSVENFKDLKHPVTCIKGSEVGDHEDLMLMRECRHHIVSNSSFGWWGAWLNYRKDKIVVAPRKWFANDRNNTKDLLPEEWIKI